MTLANIGSSPPPPTQNCVYKSIHAKLKEYFILLSVYVFYIALAAVETCRFVVYLALLRFNYFDYMYFSR